MTCLDHHNEFTQGKRSAVEIVQATYKRIQAHDPKIKAFLSLLEERALAKAKLLDEKRAKKQPLGKLAGVPVAIKDNIHIKGEITTCGSRFLTNFRAPFDATVSHLLEQEDALLIGKTNMDEFAMGSSTENSAFFPTKNPYDLNCSPGGSSGGSSAAVAARLCPAALGSDTGGSIRQPAALTGIVGMKPTYGRVSRYGLVAFASSFDQVGPFAQNVYDTALLMEVLGRHCLHDSTSLPIAQEAYTKNLNLAWKGKKVGIPWSFMEGLNVEVLGAMNASIDLMKKAGAEIVEVDLDLLRYSIALYYILTTAEASTNLARFDGVRYGVRAECKTLDELYDFSRRDGFGPEVKRRILLGTFVLSSGYQDAYYRKAQQVRTLIIRRFKEIFSQCDIVAMPTAPSTAFSLGAISDPLEMYRQDIYSIGANVAGLPAISVPCGEDKSGKPIGLQFLGPAMQDGRVLAFGHAFEQLHGPQKPPKGFA